MPARSSSTNSDNISHNAKAIPTVAFIFFTAVIVSIVSLIVMNNSLISFSPSSPSTYPTTPAVTNNSNNNNNNNNNGAGQIITTEEVPALPTSAVPSTDQGGTSQELKSLGKEDIVDTTHNNNNENENENKEAEKNAAKITADTTKKSEKGKGRANKINSKKKDTKSGKEATLAAAELDDEDADDGCNIKENGGRGGGADITTITTTKEEGSNLQLPLRPPYYILQIGEPRSGSTFQAQLIMAITDLKSKSKETATSTTDSTSTVLFRNSPNPNMRKQQKANKNVAEKHRTNQIYQGKDFFQQIISNGFVQKSHDSDWIEKTICELEKLGKDATNTNANINNHIAVFNSVVSDNDDDTTKDGLKNYNLNYDIGYNAHKQIMKSNEFRNCSLCEIDYHYKDIFDLSPTEINILKQYMSKYQLIRQCCGLQMSKYNRLRLHGCDVTEYQNNPTKHSYPWCENHNMNEIETEFDTLLKENNMIYRSVDGDDDSKWTWMKLGDCIKFDEKIKSGIDFNGARFDGNCSSLDSVDTTSKNFYLRSNDARKKKKAEDDNKKSQ
jgi:hypothetical protein